MIKRVVITLWILLFATTSETWALFGPELSLGVRVGQSSFKESEMDSATTVGVTVAVRQGQWGGQLSVDWMSADLDTSTKTEELKIVPILATAQFHFLNQDYQLDPYIGLGVGYYLNSFDSNTLDADNSAGFHISGGTSVKISEALAFTIEALYALTQTDLDNAGDTLDLDALTITGGVKYIFPR